MRSTATSIQYFLGNIGSAFAPLLAGAISQAYSLQAALLVISLSAWTVTAIILSFSLKHFKSDWERMRQKLRERNLALS
jgi:MFS family permease